MNNKEREAELRKRFGKNSEAVDRFLQTAKQAGEYWESIKQSAELEFDEASEFYLSWTGKVPPRFKRFLDWFFLVKYEDSTLAELAGKPPEVTEEDIERAGLWLAEKIRKAGHQAQGKAAPPAEELTFEGLFLNPADAARTIDAMQEIGIINEAEVWIYGKKKGALVAVWDVLKGINLVHIIPDAQAVGILAAHFQTTVAERTTRNRPAYYKELFRELNALL